MKILIFDPIISGHHLEYLHHLYMMAITRPQDRFIFVVHPDFETKRSLLEWPVSDNISFDTVYPIKKEKGTSLFKLLRSSWRLCKILKVYVGKHGVNKVFVNSIIGFVPFAPLFLREGVSISGIIYHIYLYKQDHVSKLSKILDRFKCQVMARSKTFGKIFILNDQDSADVFNREYKCNKFVGLPDPYVPIEVDDTFDFRKEHSIPPSAKLFAHFGGLAKRKGTLDILKSLKLLDKSGQRNYWFVFAGAIKDDIKESFYQMYDELKNDCHIIVKDEFCSYEYIASLCMASDAILAPYHQTNLSSGMFGYASQFGKPLIAPSQGLIGKIVRQYNLGVVVDLIDEKSLCEAYDKVTRQNHEILKDYTVTNNVRNFQMLISKHL